MCRVLRYLFFFLPSILLAEIPPYQVFFLGLEDKNTLAQIKHISDLIKLQKKTPPSLNALRYRAISDIPSMVQVLKANAYYDAYITFSIEEEQGNLFVYLFIHPGPKYILSSFEILTPDCEEDLPLKNKKRILNKLPIRLKRPVYADQVLSSQEALLQELANDGYPLAHIEKEKMIADASKKTIDIQLCLDKGPLCRFGPIYIEGLKQVDRAFLSDKILWKEGEIYSEHLIKETQNNLIATDLFSSVLIFPVPDPQKSSHLPIKIRLTESKPRSLSFGVSYATSNGPGANIGWTHRNFRGKGEQISLDAFFEKVYSQGNITYRIPDFIRLQQAWVWQGQWSRERITVYTAFNYQLLTQIEKKWEPYHFTSLGIKGEYLVIDNSIQNQTAPLLGAPFFWRYSRVKNILDPQEGFIASYKPTYYYQLGKYRSQFYKNTLWLSGYIPFHSAKKVLLALRLQLGAIWGASLEGIPLPKRFFGGSDNDLRGFKYKTVSPLTENNNPEGGRGYCLWSTELRFHFLESLGLVFFTDFGNITKRTFPSLHGKWYKSAGLGLRYFTFFGPLRLDIGFPLNPRYFHQKRFDPRYRIYVSIGQTF